MRPTLPFLPVVTLSTKSSGTTQICGGLPSTFRRPEVGVQHGLLEIIEHARGPFLVGAFFVLNQNYCAEVSTEGIFYVWPTKTQIRAISC